MLLLFSIIEWFARINIFNHIFKNNLNYFGKFIVYFNNNSALTKDFEQRPNAKEVLNHDFLAECTSASNLETVTLFCI